MCIRDRVSLDGVAPSRVVGVSASVSLPLHHKVQKFYSGTGSFGWSQKKSHKTVVVWFFLVYSLPYSSFPLRIDLLYFQAGCRKRRLNLALVFLWWPFGIGQAIIFLPCGLYLSFYLFFITYSQWSEIGCLPYFHTSCGLSVNLECKSEMCWGAPA